MNFEGIVTVPAAKDVTSRHSICLSVMPPLESAEVWDVWLGWWEPLVTRCTFQVIE